MPKTELTLEQAMAALAKRYEALQEPCPNVWCDKGQMPDPQEADGRTVECSDCHGLEYVPVAADVGRLLEMARTIAFRVTFFYHHKEMMACKVLLLHDNEAIWGYGDSEKLALARALVQAMEKEAPHD